MLKTKELKIDRTDIRPQRRGGRGERKCVDEWESDNDGGLRTSFFFALFAAAKWRCVSVLPRTCGRGELGRLMPSWSEVDGSPIRSEQAAKNSADSPP
jgi:hypothetical protein